MDKIKMLLVITVLIALSTLFYGVQGMQRVRSADEYKDLGVYTFYPQRVAPLQKETNFSGRLKRTNPTTTVYAVDYWTEQNKTKKLQALVEEASLPEPQNWREKIERGKQLRDKLRPVQEYEYLMETGGIESEAQEILAEGKPIERRVLAIPAEKAYITVDAAMTAEDYVDKQTGFNKNLAMASLTYLVAVGAYYLVKRFSNN